jgi:hypothetical protein
MISIRTKATCTDALIELATCLVTTDGTIELHIELGLLFKALTIKLILGDER